MNPFIRPISLNETSMRVNLLHKTLITLGYQITDDEVKSHTAGKSTMEQVRALQKKLKIKYDEQYIVDQATYDAMREVMIKEGFVDKTKTFVISGTVYNRKGEKVKHQKLMAVDVDLKGAAIYKSVKSEKELLNEGFEFLRARKSDANGNYYIEFYDMQFQKAERKKADVVVYALNKTGEIIGRSGIVNSEEYSIQGEVRNLHVLITKKEERTEYEIAMGKLIPFLKESRVNLIELADSKDQVKFTSGELDEKETKIQIAVDAEALRNKKKDSNNGNKKDKQKNEKEFCNCEMLSHELLYGTGRQNISLNWLVLYKKTDEEIKAAIAKSIKAQIIKEFSEKEIVSFLQIIHACAAEYALGYKGENQDASLTERLSLVLPKPEQQIAFVNAYTRFKNEAAKENLDASKFWSEYLPSQKEFKENPKLIPALLLNQQLIILTGNHLPLIEVLQSNNKISSVTQLLDYSDKNWNELIDKAGVPEYISGNSDKEKKTNYIGQLQSFVNAAYPTQKIASMLAKGELPLKDATVAKGIQTFLSQNEKFEIGKTPVHEYAEELKKVAGENYENAKSELNRMQRVFHVSTSPKVMSVLMEKNLNSAHAIANFSKKNFVKMNREALGGELVAEAVYQRAEHVSTLATERAMKMYELSHLAAPAYAFSKSDREEVVTLMQEQVSKRHNPNYSEIFGSPDLCECEHCRSVYGAAAYFVDLLQFLSKGETNSDGESPLDMFKLRRPDLLNLPLTCENSNTLIPYIDLVNEVMEYYTVHGTMDDTAGDSASYDTGDSTADELRAAPQNFKIEAYEKLKDAVYPFNLPYHQPLDVIRTYSDHLKTERYDVMKGMQKVFDTATARAIEAEALRISEEEYAVLTGEKFDGTADGRTTPDYYGNPANMEMLAGFGASDGIHEFLRRTGVKYTDLVELVKTKFINPNQDKLDFLESFSVLSGLDGATLYAKLKELFTNGTIDWTTNPELSNAITALGKTTAEFTDWIQDNFDSFNSVITLYQSSSACDLDTTYLVTIKKVYEATSVTASGITDGTWSKIHRFIRLWRKLKWTIHEVDLMLAALGESDITPDTISKLSAVVLLNKKLKLPLNKLATLWGNIDTYGDKSLYKKLFLNKTVLRLDDYFEANAFGNFLSPDPLDTTVLSDHIPAILAAFRMSEEDLSAILEEAEIDDAGASRVIDPATDKATLENLSVIYRYTVLSKILKLKVPDFCLITKLFEINPFSTLSLATLSYINISPATTLSFYDLAASIKKSGFKAEQLQYIFTGELPAESTIGLDEEKARLVLRTIREAFAAIEQEHPDEPALPLTTEIIRNKLSLTFQPDIVSQFISTVDTTCSFHAFADANLLVIIDGGLETKYSYIKATGRLICAGVMTQAENAALKLLPNINGSFNTAADSLYAQPEDFIKANFNGVFADMNAAIATLLDHPAQLPAATIEQKLLLIYTSFIPLIKQKLREDAITKHIAGLVGLSDEVIAILIKTDVQAIIDSITQDGFSAEYFSDAAFGALVLTRTDNEINFNWGATAPDLLVPANNFSVRWNGYLSPPSSGDYTLVVEVLEADDTFKLFLDGEMILEKIAADPITSPEVIASLNASQMHKIEVEYTESTGNAGIKLSWKTDTSAIEIIPQSISYPADIVDAFYDKSKLLHQAAKFISGFKLTDIEVNHFVNYSADFDAIDFTALLQLHWKRINDYVVLRNVIPQSQALLTDVFAAAKIVNPALVVDPTIIALLGLATGWDIASITELKTYYSLVNADFTNEVKLIKVYEAINFVQKTGLSVSTLETWAQPETAFDTLNSTADLVRSTVKAKYEEEDWIKLAGDLSDKIRENQKQALISYLLTVPTLIAKKVKDADSLFEYFLIDVQMGACMDTSRIVQASAAVQMFVQRCLLNLESKVVGGNEKGVSPEYIDKDRWEWMKYYRVWEVNRKIFITPENWLEPEWRDDKSPFFKELESELTQNDITDRSVETAFRNYLTKLNNVANLDVCGMYQENNSDGTIKLLHVFGHTHNAPYQFFYRTCSGTYKWSPWEKVQLDMRMTEDNDNSGVHLVPVVWKDRLFLFWAEFIKKQSENVAKQGSRDATFEEISTKSPSSVQASEYYEIRLAWSEYINGKWNPKQLTKEFVSIGPWLIANPQKEISLVTAIEGNTLKVKLSLRYGYGWIDCGTFSWVDIQSQVKINSDVEWNSYQYESANRYNNNFQKHQLNSTLEFWGNTYLHESKNHNLFFSNDVLEKESVPDAPFFYSDKERTYFVKPVDISIRHAGKNPEYYLPIVFELIDDSYFTGIHMPKVNPDDIMPEHFFSNGDPVAELENVVDEVEEINAPVMHLKSKSFSPKKKMANAAIASKKTSTAPEREAVSMSVDYLKVKDAFAGMTYGLDIYDYFAYLLKEKGFEFNTFYHPYSSNFVSNLNTDGIKGLMDSDTLRKTAVPHLLEHNDTGSTFTNKYDPNLTNGYVKQAPTSEVYNALGAYTYYKENICFDMYGSNSGYNWELFFHIPLYIATRLSKNGRYEEAMKWFHYIFDPTTDEPKHSTDTSDTSRFWKTLPFKTTPKQSIEEWFASIAGIDVDGNGENDMIQEWRNNPFKPFLVARNRPLAFMKNVVIKYVENLREWGDSLFRVFQREQVYEALQLYVMANHILGPRPEFVPKRGEIKAETYTSLAAKVLDDFSNAVVELENIFPYSSSVPVSPGTATPGLLGIGEALYFCIPSNSKLMEHWDTVADRLYKIRHCMDIDGVKRQLALFAPAIDPAMLINAAAQGLSLGSILSDLSSPPPIYRFNYLIQKANEFCGEVKSLGSTLLSALEKKDGEELSRLRSQHETMMLDLMTGIKERQVLDAKASKEGLLKSRESAEFRLQHYNGLLSEVSLTLPPSPTLDANINSESQLPNTTINEIVSDVDASLVDSEEGGIKLIPKEKSEIDDLNTARGWQIAAQATEGLAAIAHAIPTVTLDGKPFGVGPGADWGGPHLGNAISAAGKILDFVAGFYTHSAIQAAKVASYIRREQDWTLQANLAAKEIIQLDKQIVSADIKIQISEKELLNHKQQIENSKEVEQFLKNKFTNQELYQWLKEQLFSVYKQSFNMAYDMAKKVEKCYQYELGIEPTNFIQYGYWDNTMQGLCAGEKLQLALKQLEKSYIEENKRELELTKSVSMALLNPLALQELRATGKCFLSIPEELYDLDYQGHYFRRIKSVSISLPCIAGPYTTVNCTLRLLKNNVRINTSMSDPDGNYAHNHEDGIWIDDDRFRESNVPVKAIASSTGQRDSGMFELSFNDPRYLPFEGAGAISEWKIELTQDVDLRQFDYSTISDVILHISYTAREDAGLFKESAVTYLKDFLINVDGLSTQPLISMFSMKHEFSSEWHKFLNPAVAGSDQILSVTLRKENFPFFTKDRSINLKKMEVLIKANRTGDYKMLLTAMESDDSPLTSSEVSMPENSTYGNMQKATLTDDSSLTNINAEEIDVFKLITLKFKHSTAGNYHSIVTNPEEIADLFVVFHYYLGDLI